MSPPKHRAEDTPAIELIAKFQLETERALKAMRTQADERAAAVELRVAQVQDRWTALEQELRVIRQQLEDGLTAMRTGVYEVNTALKEAVVQARSASEAAKVYEKLRDAQPDFARRADVLATKIGGVQDAINQVAGNVQLIERRLDKIDGRTAEFAETTGTVRAMDRIVADLSAAEQRRKKGIPA